MKELKDTDEIKNTSPNIGYVDLIGKGEVTLTISNLIEVSGEKLDGQREAKDGTYALEFVEVPGRRLILQGRKKKWVMKNLGKKKAEIIGKKVAIFADKSVKFAGKEVGGIKFVGQD